jgi:hypothetical protein
MEQLLLVVKRRMEIKFLMMLGVTKTLERTRDRCGMEKDDDPTEVTGSKTMFLTMIDEGTNEGG